jgi:glycosyltransferase involved in cell wall biosynthesis
VLIRAFIGLTELISDVDLLIVGPCDFSDYRRYPPARQQMVSELKQEIAQAGLSPHVHWIGKVDKVHEYLQAADVFCFPTRREGFGFVIAEAMAVGLPVVVARLEGVTTDIIRSEDEGLLLTDHDPETYANALSRLLRNPALMNRMGNAARARATSQFDLDTVAQRFAQLYRELAGVAHTE